MKKILSIILTLTMLLVISAASVSAATAIDGGESTSSTGRGDGDYTLGVGAEYTPGIETAATVISVDVAWQSMEFTYTAGSVGVWDATNHKYTGGTDGGWSDRKSTITVTNHSNTTIKADFSFTAGTGITGLEGVFTNDYVVVESADSDSYRTPDPGTNTYPAPSAITQFGIDPKSDPITENKSTLGTITVSIRKVITASTEAELDEAFEEFRYTGGMIMLGADLTLDPNDDNRRVEFYDNSGTASSPLIFDLGGHTITGWVSVLGNSYITIQNGTISSKRSFSATSPAAIKVDGGGTLVLKNMTITTNSDNEGAGVALYLGLNNTYTVTIDNSTLDSGTNDPTVFVSNSTLNMNLKNNVTLSHYIMCDVPKTNITLTGGGTYSIKGISFAPESDLVLDPNNSDHTGVFMR